MDSWVRAVTKRTMPNIYKYLNILCIIFKKISKNKTPKVNTLGNP